MKIITISTVIRHKRSFLLVALAIVILGALYLLNNRAGAPDETLSSPALPVVTLITPAEFAGQSSLTLLGTARASSEAQITAERSGRITSVPVSLGQRVSAGQIIATIDSASERAAVLQAEGVYDAAVAAGAQSDIGVEQAQTNVLSARNNAVAIIQSAYNLGNTTVRNNIDPFFSNPSSQIPGLRIDGRGYTSTLNAERIAYQTLLPQWQQSANTASIEDDLESAIGEAGALVQRTTAFVDMFITVFSNQTNLERNTNPELQTNIANFSNLRSSLIGMQSNLDSARSALTAANEVLRRAELSASGGPASATDAQVKQALGALRAAEANLAKTVFRTPISGTVNELSVRTGDFVNSFATVAVVANNNALEIITAISEQERLLLQVNDEVVINGTTPGVVTNIAPSISPQTGKFEVRIASEANTIAAGETVRITKVVAEQVQTTAVPRVPLAAVKFEATDGYVFVVEENTLVARPVKVGVVRGSAVEILDGISPNDNIVKDARGLNSGEEVTVHE